MISAKEASAKATKFFNEHVKKEEAIFLDFVSKWIDKISEKGVFKAIIELRSDECEQFTLLPKYIESAVKKIIAEGYDVKLQRKGGAVDGDIEVLIINFPYLESK